MSWPLAVGVRSTSIGAPAAIVEASGFIWAMNGQSVATPPTAAAAPVATKRKSRRVGGSAEDAVVTIPNPSKAAAGGPAPGNAPTMHGRLPAPATPAAAERPLLPANRAEQAVQNRSIGTLAGRAQARYRLIRVQCTNSAQSDVLFRHFIGTDGLSQKCRLRFSSPTFPRTPGRFFVCARPGWGRPTSGTPRFFRYPTATSDAPAWTISTRSASRDTTRGRNSS